MNNDLLSIAQRAEADARGEVYRLQKEADKQARRVGELDQEITKKLQVVAAAMVAERQNLPPSAAALLRDRDAREQALRQEISDLEAKLAAEKKKAETAEKNLAEARAAAQAHLLASPEYLALVDQKTKVRNARELAVANIDALSAECGEKRVAYDDHPFYQYLVNANFGTPDYKRKGLTRAIDTWLAKWCNYEVNRRNELILHAMADECATTQQSLTTQRSEIDGRLGELTKEVEERFNIPALTRACNADNAEGTDGKYFPALARALGLSDERKHLQASIAERWEEINLFIATEDPFFKQAVQVTFSDLLLSPMEDVVQRARNATSLRLGHMVDSLKGLGAERDHLLAMQEQSAGERQEAAKRLERAVELNRRAGVAAPAPSKPEPSGDLKVRSRAPRSRQSSVQRNDDSVSYMAAGYMLGASGQSNTPASPTDHREAVCDADEAQGNRSRHEYTCAPKEREADTDRTPSDDVSDSDSSDSSGD